MIDVTGRVKIMPSEDITFCGYFKCPNKKCERQQSNIKNYSIPHSFAYFHDCNKYPPMEFSEEHQEITGE